MPPIRRYIRISTHSLLEVRIFIENPADIPRWLLSHVDPALPKVFDAVRPLILPKLREERERTALTKGKGKKGKSVKDVVEREGFRVVVFLTEGGTRHEVAVKVKTARESGPSGGRGIGVEKMGDREVRGKSRADAVVIREEEEDGDVNLLDLPAAPADDGTDDEGDGVVEISSRSRRDHSGGDVEDDVGDGNDREDKKKLGFDTRYEGFSIWGKVLCLLVERKGGPGKKSGQAGGDEGAQKVMQEWISSTQVGAGDEDG